jgi:hypothetical protein
MTAERYFINVQRYFLFSYGLMPYWVHFAFVALIFKINFLKKYLIYIAGTLMIIAWILSITRRQILGIMIIAILTYIIYIYITKGHYLVAKSGRYFLSILLGVGLIILILPKTTTVIEKTWENTFQTIETGVTISGKEEYRLTLNHPFFLELIKRNPLFGTGYDANWFVGEGKSEKSQYETSDYPLLAAIAMFGFMGIAFFSYYYFWLIRFIYNILKNIRKMFSYRLLQSNNIEFIIIIGLITELIFGLFQYMNYFNVMGLRFSFMIPLLFIPMILGSYHRIIIKSDHEKT